MNTFLQVFVVLSQILSVCSAQENQATLARGRIQTNEQSEASYRYDISAATYLGGSQTEQAREIIVYPDGSLLVGGITMSSDLPTTPGVLQPNYAGDDPATGHPGMIGGDAFLVHLSADLTTRLAATYFGGSRQERGVYGMEVDTHGDIIIVCATRSDDMPTTEHAFQPRYGGGLADAYVAKLSSDLRELRWGTYVGGSHTDWPRGGLALDDHGNIYVVGRSDSANFPTTAGVVQRKLRGRDDAMIFALRHDGSRMRFSTLLGGSQFDTTVGVRVGADGSVYIGGHTASHDFPMFGAAQPRAGGRSDAFLARLSGDGTRLVSSTYLGGSGNEYAEHRLTVVEDGSVLLPGAGSSTDFPVTPRALGAEQQGQADGFLARLSSGGKEFKWKARIGGSGQESWLMPTVDAAGNIFIVGYTTSRDFPVTAGALQPNFGGGRDDGVLAVVSGDGTRLLYATYLGGTGSDIIRSIALSPDGTIYLVGGTDSLDFPVVGDVIQSQPAGGHNAFVVSLKPRC